MAIKRLMKGLPKTLPDLEDPFRTFLLTKATKINIGKTIDDSKISPGFMLQMYFTFFNAEIICGLTSTFLAICYAT